MNLVMQENQLTMSTRDLAKVSGKAHKNVLRVARDLISAKLVAQIEPSKYKSRGKLYDHYEFEKRDCFVIVARLSPEFTAALVDRWQALEEKHGANIRTLAARNDARLEAPFLTDAIKLTRQDEGKETRHYHYTNEFDMLNRLVLGMSAKQYKETHGIDKNSPLRDNLTEGQITALAHLQRSNTGMIEAGLDYATRKQKLDRLFVSRYSKMLFDEIKRLEF